MQNNHCIKCDRLLTNDEAGLHKKLFNRGATQYMCIHCISNYLDVSEDILRNKIQYFKKIGCTLFMTEAL